MHQDGVDWKAKDGIVDTEIFASQEVKILWILREPNGEGFDFMSYLKNPTNYNRWKASYGLVVKISYAMINKISDWKSIPDPSKIVHETMSKIAIMNIKKTGGKATINSKKILAYSLENKNTITSQIIDISPDIIIFGGTKNYILPDEINTIKAKIDKPVKTISAYHPNQRKITHKEYINKVLSEFYRK